jgi:hypothetical protein
VTDLERKRQRAREAHARRMKDPEYRARRAEKQRLNEKRRSEDPEYREHILRKNSRWRRDHALYDRGRKYGLTGEETEALLMLGCCEVCGKVAAPRKNGACGLHIDHRHDNGAVRGVLCAKCNVAAGVLDSDPEYLRRLAEFVQRGADSDAHMVAIVGPSGPLREVA